MSEIQIFKNESFGEVRVTEVNGEPMFCLADVAKALEYTRPADAVAAHCKGVAVLPTPTYNQYGAEVIQQMKYGKESEVYRLIMKSKAKRAEEFQDWVCEEVLPTIRKTGSYSMPSDYLSALKALVASEEEKQRLALENTTMKPKAEYYDALVDRKCLLNFTDTAKELKIARTVLINILLENKWIFRNNGKDLRPYAKYVDKGYFEMKEFHNENRSNTQTLITVAGRDAIMNKLLTVKIK